MTPEWWLAHILLFHLSVPEPVEFKKVPLWPSGSCAEMRYDLSRDSWEIGYDTSCWDRKPKIRMWVIAHEACHGVNEKGLVWSELPKKERSKRHKWVNACADKILRDHKEEQYGVEE